MPSRSSKVYGAGGDCASTSKPPGRYFGRYLGTQVPGMPINFRLEWDSQRWPFTPSSLRTGSFIFGALELSVTFDTRVADRRSRPQPLALRLRHHAAAPSDTIVSEDG